MDDDAGALRIEGASIHDQGPEGAVARFLDACSRDDEDGARANLTLNSQEGFNINAGPRGTFGARVEEIQLDGEDVIVPVTLASEDGEQTLPFLVRFEGAGWLVDMEATMERLLGCNPNELLESMGQAMAGGMEAMGEALATGLGAMTGATLDSPPGDTVGEDDWAGYSDDVEAEWELPVSEVPHDVPGALELVRRIGRYLEPPFEPGDSEFDRQQSEDGSMRNLYARHGDEDAGFRVQESVGGDHYLSISITTYGILNGASLAFNLIHMRDQGVDMHAEAKVTVTATEMARKCIGAYLGGRFGIDD